MIHQLKIESKYFDKIAAGLKTFEVRNDDREFHPGDYIGLNELTVVPVDSSGKHKETGRFILVKVVDVFKDNRFLKDGYAILSILPCHIVTDDIRRVDVYTEEVEQV